MKYSCCDYDERGRKLKYKLLEHVLKIIPAIRRLVQKLK